MPALPPVPNVLRCVQHYLLAEDAFAITRHFIRWTGTTPSGTTLDNLANDLFVDWSTVWGPYTHPTTTFTKTELEDLTSPTGAVGSHSGAVVGTGTGGVLSAQTAILANLHINRRYRGGKPRMYIPSGTESDIQDAQTWKTSSQTNFHAALEQYRSDIAATVFAGTTLVDLVNVGYYAGFTAVTNPITGRTKDIPKAKAGPIIYDSVLSTSINIHLGTQRRRTQIRA